MQKYNNSFGTANQTGGDFVLQKRVRHDLDQRFRSSYDSVTTATINTGRQTYTFSAANGYGADDVIQYYFALTFDATGGGSSSVETTYVYGGNGDAGGLHRPLLPPTPPRHRSIQTLQRYGIGPPTFSTATIAW